MNLIFKIIICSLCMICIFASVGAASYKAANVHASEDFTTDNYLSVIHEAAKLNADILVLPSPELSRSENHREICVTDKYDEIVKSISDAAKKLRLYIVAHVLEKIRCHERKTIIRNNLVFDRDGSVIAVYRKPLQMSAQCNITNAHMGSFTTDFGVTFGVLMEEDLLLKSPEEFKGLKNFVMTGKSAMAVPFLTSTQFASSWSYMTNSNLVSDEGIFAGKAGLRTGPGRLVTDLKDYGGEEHSTVYFDGERRLEFPGEDLSLYTIRPLDVEASVLGYKETVCHDNFCCFFHLKTRLLGTPKEVNYGLVVYSGIKDLGLHHGMGIQICAVVACAGLKRSCFIGSENTTNIAFERAIVTGNFTNNSAQYLIVQAISETAFKSKNIVIYEDFTDTRKEVTAKMLQIPEVLQFGILSRDFDMDKLNFLSRNISNVFGLTDFAIGNVQELFDYLWIRLRVVIFIVSIYILEMM